MQDATRKQGEMTYGIGAMVDIAGTPWEIISEYSEDWTLEHADGTRVVVPKKMFGPDPDEPQVGDVWLFRAKSDDGYPEGYVQVVAGGASRWYVVYVAARHPELAKRGPIYVNRAELIERVPLQVATTGGLLADEVGTEEFVPGREYLFTQPEMYYTGGYPTGRVVYERPFGKRWHLVQYRGEEGYFSVRTHELSQIS